MDARTPEAIAAKAPLSEAEIRSTLIGLMLAMFLSALDGTIVATALPTIGRDLGDSEHLAWIVTAYLLASTAVTPLYGKASDMHGRRVTMLTAIALFIVGSIACALAPSMLILALARGLQGLGGGGLVALAQIVTADMISPRERGSYQVYFGTTFAAASVLGPVLGGIFAEDLHWSGIFWINLPLGLLAFWLVNDKLKKLERPLRRHRLDVLGSCLLIGATSTLMLALSWGGSAYPWGSLPILALTGGSLVLWAMFVLRLLTAVEPLIPLPVLGDRVVATAILAGGVTMAVYIGLIVTVPAFFETTLGLSARQSGLALIGFMVGVPIGATVSGRAMAHLVRYKRVPTVGLAVAAMAVGTFAHLGASAPLWLIELQLGIAAAGLGTVLPVATVAMQNAVTPHHLGTATATMNFMRQLLASVVVAVFGAIALGGSGLLHEVSGRAKATDISGFVVVFWLAAGGLVLALVLLSAMEERPLRGRASLAETPAVD